MKTDNRKDTYFFLDNHYRYTIEDRDKDGKFDTAIRVNMKTGKGKCISGNALESLGFDECPKDFSEIFNYPKSKYEAISKTFDGLTHSEMLKKASFNRSLMKIYAKFFQN